MSEESEKDWDPRLAPYLSEKVIVQSMVVLAGIERYALSEDMMKYLQLSDEQLKEYSGLLLNFCAALAIVRDPIPEEVLPAEALKKYQEPLINEFLWPFEDELEAFLSKVAPESRDGIKVYSRIRMLAEIEMERLLREPPGGRAM